MFNFEFNQNTLQSLNYDFNFGINVRVFYILLGETNNITSVWTTCGANFDSGIMYIGSDNSLNIINLESKSCIDYYTTTHSGIAREVLDDFNITDINVVN